MAVEMSPKPQACPNWLFFRSEEGFGEMSEFSFRLLRMAGIGSSGLVGEYDWHGIEGSVGFSLPRDYKIISSACEGLRVGAVSLVPPRQKGHFPGILEETGERAEVMSDVYEVDLGSTEVPLRKNGSPLREGSDPFHFHPVRPGLLAWGQITSEGLITGTPKGSARSMVRGHVCP
ncbi:hypothetical protein ACFWTE_00370 [Nocardiopsis sp. NPDC058631]|uniref:hypothetical protein n=1 Tax=Nocardiopsis sp. NPDC058631 TaxID=3346566 RepID=UPI00365481F3